MTNLQVYINNASKMIDVSKLSEQQKNFTILIYDLLNYKENKVNVFYWFILLILDIKLLTLPITAESGLKILKRNIDRPTPASKWAMKLFLSKNWLKKIEEEFGKKSAIPALYWAVFVQHGFINYKD